MLNASMENLGTEKKSRVESAYFAMLPAATPPNVVKKVDGLLINAMSDPAIQERIRATGLEPSRRRLARG
jgi:tripartite-type tricarboxylate transporter receptor subunit TctC